MGSKRSIMPSSRDQEVYYQELQGFLPERIFDAHVHLFARDSFAPDFTPPARDVLSRFECDFTLENYLGWVAEWLPEQSVYLNSFGFPLLECDLERTAAYTGSISDNQRFFGMTMVSPDDTALQVKQRVLTHKLVGLKPYMSFVVNKSAAEVLIPEMLPSDQMAVANELGLIITLHIPGSKRLADPDTRGAMVKLCKDYPNAKIIFAHIGRAYFMSGVRGLLSDIAECDNSWIDTAMINHPGVLEYAFNHFPRERVVFGSDAPIALLRGKSVEINNQYAYLMGEDYAIGSSIYDPQCRVEFTTFYYEQLRGIILAAKRVGLSSFEIENIFFNNACQLFTTTAKHLYGVS